MIQRQAKLENLPNILAGDLFHRNARSKRDTGKEERRLSHYSSDENTRTMKTHPESDLYNEGDRKDKYCSFHDRKGHDLLECKAFGTKSLEEKTQWIKTASLCFRCLMSKHCASQCNVKVECKKCDSERHLEPLHNDKEDRKDEEHKDDEAPEDNDEEVNSACTAI